MAENYIDKIEVDGVERPIRDTSGSVRYDTAQSLTDEQKAQARTNIGAAPDGFGLGASSQAINIDWNEALSNGWWRDGDDNLLNRPFPGLWGIGLTTNYRKDSHLVQSAFWVDSDGSVYQKIRGRYQGGTWGAWEWVNPPMQLGVEYRTIERYLGKPVYVQLVNFGALGNATTKSVDVAIENVDKIPVLGGTALEVPLIPGSYNGAISGISATRTSAKITISITTTADLSWMQAEVLLGYTKTTD